jgi:hypothetical protein
MEAWREELNRSSAATGNSTYKRLGQNLGESRLPYKQKHDRRMQRSSRNPFEQNKAFKSEI